MRLENQLHRRIPVVHPRPYPAAKDSLTAPLPAFYVTLTSTVGIVSMRNKSASPSRSWAIAELAQELEISTRTIRFYEEKGLISPERTSGNRRIYSKRDRARLKLILRGKRFGYSLGEIGEMIGMGAADLEEREQIKRSLAYGDKKLGDIRQRIEELKMLAEDIETMRAKLLAKLRELEPQGGNGSHEPGGDTGA